MGGSDQSNVSRMFSHAADSPEVTIFDDLEKSGLDGEIDIAELV